MPTRTTARPAPTTAELRDFLAGLGPDTDAAILRAVATVDALRAPLHLPRYVQDYHRAVRAAFAL